MLAVIFDAFSTLFDISTGSSAKKTVISNIRSCGKSVDEEKFAEEWKAFYIANTTEYPKMQGRFIQLLI